MTWFYDLNIGKKLLLGFIFVSLLAGVVGAFGIYNLRHIAAEDKLLYEKFTVPVSELVVMTEEYWIIRAEFRNMLLEKDPGKRGVYAPRIREAVQKLKSILQSFDQTTSTDEGRKAVAAFRTALGEYEPYVEKLIGLVQANQMDQATQVMESEGPRLNKAMNDDFARLQALKIAVAKQKAEANQETAYKATITVVGIVVLGVVLAIFIGIVISRIISKPITRLVEAADKLAVGDVNVNIAATTKDEIGTLMNSFSKMVESIHDQALVAEKIAAGDMTVQVKIRSENDLLGKNLSKMVEMVNQALNSIYESADQVASGAQQIAASGELLSQGSTEQASAIEEITSSMEEVASQTKQNATNANQANQLTISTKEQAVEGNIQMQEMVKAMTEINESSANISKIIKVIDEIAFQTNILALNAAVEAARAGQHGKGFAVVAEEVRNLAARSADAAKETTAMIEGSIKKVGVGSQIANQTAQALNVIVDGVAKAAMLVGDIAAASNEQTTAITQVNQAIAQVSQVVQTNSSTAEESAAASEELSSQAEAMKANVSKFQLKQSSYGLHEGESLSPKILRAIETMMAHKRQEHRQEARAGKYEPMLTRAKIVLDAGEFGKY
jgi:methyl-accepting chemotaxis protein